MIPTSCFIRIERTGDAGLGAARRRFRLRLLGSRRPGIDARPRLPGARATVFLRRAWICRICIELRQPVCRCRMCRARSTRSCSVIFSRFQSRGFTPDGLSRRRAGAEPHGRNGQSQGHGASPLLDAKFRTRHPPYRTDDDYIARGRELLDFQAVATAMGDAGEDAVLLMSGES